MEIMNVTQGSPEWLELRAKHFNASEAPAMMGESKYMTRDALLKLKHTGESEPVSSFLQELFDKGHAAEADIRPHIEGMIIDDLYPVTGIKEINGISLLASFDGLTMAGDIAFEHKLWNEKLAAIIKNKQPLPRMYTIQMEQQLMVSGAEKDVFVVSNGAPEKMVHTEYVSDPKLRLEILAGWAQFKIDLEDYTPPVEETKAAVKVIKDLPAINIRATAMVSESNLAVYEEAATQFIGEINTDLTTDEDFGNAVVDSKFCKDKRAQIKSAIEAVLGQTGDIDAAIKTLNKIDEEFRLKAKELDSLVVTKKDEMKAKIVNEGQAALDKHIQALNDQFNRPYITFTTDFRLAIKGKRTITSIRSAINDTLATAKIATSADAMKIGVNVKTMGELATDHKFLFHDIELIINKENDDFILLVKSRIADHEAEIKAKAEEKERLEAEAEAEEKESQRVAYYESMIKHIQQCAHGFIGGEPQPFGILFRELEEKIKIDSSWGEFEAPALEEKAKAITALKALQESSNAREQEAEAAEAEQSTQTQPESEPAQENPKQTSTGPSDSELLAQQDRKLAMQLKEEITDSLVLGGIDRKAARNVAILIANNDVAHVGIID
jgi:predicted phage-related endonuclease